MKKHLLLGILFLLILKISHAQGSKTASKTLPLIFEKVYLQTDRKDYAAGEEIWFKAYLIDGQTSRPSPNSNNLYIELIAPNSEIISKKVIRLDGGLGDNYFKLLDSIAAGKYIIRAYTNWMRNYGDFFIYNKEINIYQPDQKIVSILNSKTKKTSPEKPLQQKTLATKETIQLFPEGGAMINQISGLIAFKAEDSNGKGIGAKGDVVDANGDKITSFETSHLGMGSFYLTPENEKNYFLKGNYANGKTFNIPITKALNEGFSLHTQQTDSLTRIIISTNKTSLTNWKGKEFKLLGKSKSKIFYGVTFILNDDKIVVDIENKTLMPGINLFTIYDTQNKPYAERLIFIKEKDRLKLNLITDKSAYQPKEKTTVKIKLVDGNQSNKAMLSLAAVDTKIATSLPQESIISYLLLQSEVKGEIENPESYFDQTDPARFQKLDLLLLTQGWRDFIWKTLAQGKTVISQMPEQGFNITGRVREKRANKGIDKVNITLSIPGAEDQKLFFTQTDTAGRFYFDGISMYGPQRARLNSRNAKGQKMGWILLDSIYQKSPKIELLNRDTFQNISTNLLTEINRRKEIKAKYSLADTIGLKEVVVRDKSLDPPGDLKNFGYKDQVLIVNPQDSDFYNLKHYLLTNVNGAFDDPSPDTNSINFISNGKRVRPRLIVDKNDLAFFNPDPTDTTQVSRNNEYYDLPMNKIEKVVVKHMVSIYSSDVYLIYLTLKPGALDQKELDVLNTKLMGYAAPRTFYSPKYVMKNQTNDVRNTIHWEPNITTNENGEATVSFYNADPNTKIRVVAEGISETGVPLSAIIYYDVKGK